MPTKQQHIQQFRNRLSKDRALGSEHILSNEQFQSAIDDAVNLFGTVKYTSNTGIATQITDSALIALPLDFADGMNDDLLLALSVGATPNLPKYGYANLNFGAPLAVNGYNFLAPSSYQGYGSASYSYGRQNLSNPVLPNNPVRKRPTLQTITIGGVIYPAIEVYPIPTSDLEIPITYIAKQSVTDDELILTFSALPSNGQTFILDGATFQFVNTTPATSLQIAIGLTLSATTLNMQDVLTGLGFVSEASGQSISISNSTGTVFSYTISGLTTATGVYASSIDTIDPNYRFALYDLMKAKTLDYLISQNLLENEKIDELFKYSQELIEKTLLKLNT